MFGFPLWCGSWLSHSIQVDLYWWISVQVISSSLGPLILRAIAHLVSRGERPLGFGDIKMQGLLFSLDEKFDCKTSLRWFLSTAPESKLGRTGSPFSDISFLHAMQIFCLKLYLYRVPVCEPIGITGVFLFSFVCRRRISPCPLILLCALCQDPLSLL
jgi:hypothetical protein